MSLLDSLKDNPKFKDMINFDTIKEKRKYKKILGKEKYNVFKEMVNTVFKTNNFKIDIEDNYYCIDIDLETEKVKCSVVNFINEKDHMKFEFELSFENETFYNSSCYYLTMKNNNLSRVNCYLKKTLQEEKGIANIDVSYNNGEEYKRKEINYDQLYKEYMKNRSKQK